MGTPAPRGPPAPPRAPADAETPPLPLPGGRRDEVPRVPRTTRPRHRGAAELTGASARLQGARRAARQSLAAALEGSRGVECAICLEAVLEKERAEDRQFGLLECDHPFCLPCIRDWRAQLASGASVDDAVRTCPLCRTPSHFVCPSTVWPSSREQREEIVQGYTRRLAQIDCRHFAFGDGACPFGTSCFYRHAFRDGTVAEKAVRTAVGDDGVRVVNPIKASDFLGTDAARRVLRR